MLHLKPIDQAQATAHVAKLYGEITSTFSVNSVPLLFQYLANFPDFFSYVWGKSALNLHSSTFSGMADHMITLATQAVHEIYKPSEKMHTFVATISPHEVAYLQETAASVMQLNARMLVLTIGIRENIKGVFIGQKLLSNAIYTETASEEDFSMGIKPYAPRDASKPQDLRLTSASALLAPLFSNGLATSSLPYFFSHIDTEIHLLLKTERYLEKRVLLEQEAMLASYSLPHPLGASYQEIVRLAGNKPYFHELLYLLVETFPTAYPRMLFTTSIMLQSLKKTHEKHPVPTS